MPRKPVPVLLNALHTSGGGGLVYLQGVLPHLVQDERVQWHLLAPTETLAKITVPAAVVVHPAPVLGFGVSHLWEQFWLPMLARVWGCRMVLSNANYGPLLAPRAAVILHTTPRAAVAWQGMFWKVYWALLKILTRGCVWRAPVFFSVAKHIVRDYAGPRALRKMRLAPPAIRHEALPQGLTRDPKLVLAVGDFYPQKNYPLLMEAFAKLRSVLPGVRLTIIGRPVQPAIRDEILRLARAHDITEGLTLIPGVPHDALMKAMAQAAVYISTSSAEAFNMPVLEAMASGTPCIALPEGAPSAVIGAWSAGEAASSDLAEPDSKAPALLIRQGGDLASALAIGLLGLLSNTALAETLARRGQAYAAQFTWQATAQSINIGVAKALRLN